MKTDILYGIHPVGEALRAGRRRFLTVYTTPAGPIGRLNHLATQAGSLNIPVKIVNPSRIKSLSGTDAHQGIAARVGPYPYVEISRLAESDGEKDRVPFILLLDGVLDPHNLGAIIRTALCAGVGGIVITKNRSANPTPAVSKASAGAMEHVRLARVTNLVRTIQALKQKGLWILGMDRNAGMSIYNRDFTGPVGIVIGGEEKGMRRLVRNNCDETAAIPQTGPVTSLNASVAGAVVMYEAVRQRKTQENANVEHPTSNGKSLPRRG